MKFLHDRSDFNDIINIASSETQIPVAFVAKDYWVTEILRVLQDSDLKDKFIFKGGTSLSKAYGIINRFSEDIDLLFIGGEDIGKNARRKMMKTAESLVSKSLNIKLDKENPDCFSSDDHKASCLVYPASDKSGVLPFVKLEMGFRGGHEPSEYMEIQSILAKHIVSENVSGLNGFNLEPFKLKILDPLRTMAEKIFSLHRAFHDGRVKDKERHFYDIFCILKLKGIYERVGTEEYKEIKADIAKHDTKFNNKHIPEDLDFSGSPIFTKDHAQYSELKTTYQQSQIYFGARPDFDEIINYIIKFRESF